MPVINLGQNRRYDAPRETSTATGSEMVTNAVAGLGETVAGVSAEIVDKITTQKAKVEVSKAERIFKTRFQELSQEALLEPGLDGAALAGRLEEAKLQAESEAGSVFQTGRGADVFESMREDMLGSAERHAADLVVKRTGEITVADTDAQTEALREEMATATPEEQARLRAQIFDLNDGLEPFIGVDEVERRRQALVQDTREIMGFTEVDTRLGLKDGKFNHEKGLKFAEGVKFGKEMRDEDMTPDERVQLGNQLISYVGALKERDDGSGQWNTLMLQEAEKQAERGRLTKEFIANMDALALDPKLAPRVWKIQQIYAAAAYADMQSVPEAGAELTRLKAKPSDEVTTQDSILMTALERRVKQKAEVLPDVYTQDEAAEFLRIAPRNSTVDWNAPQDQLGVMVSMASREATGLNKQLSSSGKGRVLAISNQSLGELTQVLDQNDHGKSYEKLSALASGLTGQQYSDIVQRLPPAHKLKAYAATLPPEVGITVMQGQERMKEIGRPPVDSYVPVFEEKASPALRAMPKTRALALDAVEAFVVAKSGKDVSDDAVEEAIAAVLDPVVEYNGSSFLSPFPNMTDKQFEKAWEGLQFAPLPNDVAPSTGFVQPLAPFFPDERKGFVVEGFKRSKVQTVAGWGSPVDAAGRELSVYDVVQNGRLISIGQGLYHVSLSDDDSVLQDGTRPGKPWVLNLREVLGN